MSDNDLRILVVEHEISEYTLTDPHGIAGHALLQAHARVRDQVGDRAAIGVRQAKITAQHAANPRHIAGKFALIQPQLGAQRLVIAGGTAGVLDDAGQTIERLTSRAAARLIRTGTANRGMVTKLEACRAALRKGVGDVLIASGRDARIEALADTRVPLPGCTQVVR